MVGAASLGAAGLYYQWGDIVGHSVSDGYDFNQSNYIAKGLLMITSDLDDAHDAARAFYGPNAKMPTREQMQELLQYTSKQAVGAKSIRFTSLINSESIVVYCGGYIAGLNITVPDRIRIWLKDYVNNENALSLHSDPDSDIDNSYTISDATPRIRGMNIMAVHS